MITDRLVSAAGTSTQRASAADKCWKPTGRSGSCRIPQRTGEERSGSGRIEAGPSDHWATAVDGWSSNWRVLGGGGQFLPGNDRPHSLQSYVQWWEIVVCLCADCSRMWSRIAQNITRYVDVGEFHVCSEKPRFLKNPTCWVLLGFGL